MKNKPAQTKLLKTDVLNNDFDFNHNVDILIEKFADIKKLYGDKYSRLYFDKDYAYDSSFWRLLGDREETDSEKKQRTDAENKRKFAVDEQDRLIYERLKAKFKKEEA